MRNQIEILNLGFVNCYLVAAENGFILVDTGIADLRKKLEQKLFLAGCKPGNLKLIIITHGDIDHAGNGKYLRDAYGAPIAMHVKDLDMVEKAQLDSTRQVNSNFMRFMQFLAGLNNGFEKMASQFEVFSPDILLEDGKSLIDYGVDAEVMHIPGHTDGSISILFNSGDLICGDTMQNGKSAIIVKNEKNLIDSITKLSKLNIDMIYPGHGKPFKWNGMLIKKLKRQYKY